MADDTTRGRRSRARAKDHPVPVPTPTDAPGLADSTYLRQWIARRSTRSPHTGAAYGAGVLRAEPDIMAAGGFRHIGPREAGVLAAAWYRRWAPATVNTMLSALAALWDDLAADGHVTGPNPWRQIPRPRPRPRVGDRLLTPEEVRRLIQAAPPGEPRTLLRFLYYTGARASEVAALRWRDILRLADGTIACRLFGKGRKERTVRLRPALWAALQQLPSRRQGLEARVFDCHRATIWRIVRAAADAAGLGDRGVSPHWLRHCHASHALQAGASIVEVQETLGHARLDTTRIYAQLAPGPRSEAYLEDY
jgi:integrase/recombinase XerD